MHADALVNTERRKHTLTKLAHRFSGALWSPLISWSIYNLIMCVSSPPLFYSLSVLPPTPPIPAVNWGGKNVNHQERAKAWWWDRTERNKHGGGRHGGGGGGRCVLTVGMSATLWVIKKEIPLLPLPPSLESECWSRSWRGVWTRPKTHHPEQPVHQTPPGCAQAGLRSIWTPPEAPWGSPEVFCQCLSLTMWIYVQIKKQLRATGPLRPYLSSW